MKAASIFASALLIAPAIALLPARPAAAHEELFLWSYDYMTADQGERELELRSTGGYSGYEKEELSLEYGVTDHFSVEPYFVMASDVGEGLHPDALKLEARARLLEPGVLPVDVAFYLEPEFPFTPGDPDDLEGRLILERDLGRWTLCANGIGTRLFGPAAGTLFGGSAGVSYALDRHWDVNLELLSGQAATDISTAPTDLRASGTYLGPSVTATFGAFHLVAGAGAGVTPGSDPLLARVFLSNEF